LTKVLLFSAGGSEGYKFIKNRGVLLTDY